MSFGATGVDALSGELVKLYERYGYARFRMNKFEEYDLYVRNKDFLVSDSIITFTDTNGKLMALKPDVTLSIIKNGKDVPSQVQKVYYNENVYRVSRGNHAFREIGQVGLECMGDVDDYTIYEVLLLAAESLKAVSSEYVLDVSQLTVVDKVLDRSGVSGEDKRALLKCIGEKNMHGVRQICQSAGVDAEMVALMQLLVDADADASGVLARLRGFSASEAFADELDQLERILAMLNKGAHKGHVRLDFSVLNDMNYYNGIAFNGFVPGLPSSVLSGGQYDRLMRKMGRHADAIGFALYMDLLEYLRPAREDFDVDVVLLYDRDVPLEKLSDVVNVLTAGGRRVMAQKALPDKLRCKQLLRLGESGVEILEQHA